MIPIDGVELRGSVRGRWDSASDEDEDTWHVTLRDRSHRDNSMMLVCEICNWVAFGRNTIANTDFR